MARSIKIAVVGLVLAVPVMAAWGFAPGPSHGDTPQAHLLWCC